MLSQKLSRPRFFQICVFEFIFKCLIGLTFGPLFRGLLTVLMKLQGYSYLSWENIQTFILSPLSLCACLVIFIFLAALSLFENLALMWFICPEQTEFKGASEPLFVAQQTSTKIALTRALKSTVQALHPKNWGYLLFGALILPLSNIGLASRVVERFSIPEFVMTAIYDQTTLTLLYLALLFVINILVIRLIYVLPGLMLKKDFSKSVKLSLYVGKSHLATDFLAIIGWQISLAIFYFALRFVLQLLLGYTQTNLADLEILREALLSLIVCISFTTTLAYTLLSPAILWLLILFRYNAHVARKSYPKTSLPIAPSVLEKRYEELPPHPLSVKSSGKFKKIHLRPIALVGFMCFWLLGFSALLFVKSNLFKATKLITPSAIEVTAHRGDVTKAPENTMAAFRAAQESGAEWVELDVQQSRDGQIFVSHDSSFKRVAKVNKYAWELNYSDIEKLSAGEHYSEEFKNEKFPLLEEVLIWAKENRMRLNIELKPTGHEHNFEKSVVDLIHRYNMENRCILTSMNYKTLERIKKVDPKQKTAYVMTLAFGDLTQLKAADIYSVEVSSCTKPFVSWAHKHNKEVLAWTVSDTMHISKCVANGVDNIISDNVGLAHEITQEPRGLVYAQAMLYQYLGMEL